MASELGENQLYTISDLASLNLVKFVQQFSSVPFATFERGEGKSRWYGPGWPIHQTVSTSGSPGEQFHPYGRSPCTVFTL